MRRLTFVGAFMTIMLWASPVLGQGIGAHAGITFATAAGDDVPDVEYKSGFSFGAYATLNLAPMLSFRPELNYMAKGAEITGIVDGTGQVNLTYIQVPLLLRLSLPNPVGPRPYVFAGPAVSFEAGCKLEGESGGVSVSVDCNDPSVDFLEPKSLAWDLVGGAGVGFGLGLGEATIGARYDLGLTDIEDGADAKNRAISVMVGYTLGLGM